MCSAKDLTVLLLHNIDRGWDAADRDQVSQETVKVEMALREWGHPVIGIPVYNQDSLISLREYAPDRHIVFHWCEEISGVQYGEAIAAQILEELHFTYTGSTSEVLRFCWDKCSVKRLLDRCSVPTPRWGIYESPEVGGWTGFPAIVKPSREHCSYGVTTEAVVLSPGELKDRIAYVLDTFHQPALVEDFIDGREFHVSCWGNGDVQMLPPAEMDFAVLEDVRDRLCTYDSKFSPGSVLYEKIGLRLPAPLRTDEYERLKSTCILAYNIAGCRDYARLDVRLRDGIFYVLDVNPNADISADASMACAAEAAGYSYGEMIGHIVNLAAQRHPIFQKHNI